MIFFEGFGSLIPYLIYLSLIWICLIFGFRGQLLEILRLPSSKNQVISPASLKTYDSKIFNYFETAKSEHQPEKTSTGLNTIKNFTFRFANQFNLSIKGGLDFYKSACFFYFFLRRGPPPVNIS
jgi:hypothetical protein